MNIKTSTMTNYKGVRKGKVWNFGNVVNPETNATEEVELDIIKALKPKTLLIGGGLIAAGFTYICLSSYKNGADAFMNAEVVALAKAGLWR